MWVDGSVEYYSVSLYTPASPMVVPSSPGLTPVGKERVLREMKVDRRCARNVGTSVARNVQ